VAGQNRSLANLRIMRFNRKTIGSLGPGLGCGATGGQRPDLLANLPTALGSPGPALGARAIPADALAVVALSSDRGRVARPVRSWVTPADGISLISWVGQWRNRPDHPDGTRLYEGCTTLAGEEITLALLPGDSTAPQGIPPQP
jgi:hypothetical protein